ncbi:MAG: AMP-binding protein [Chloroflexi bacterium]|nr:AMP-binding protein [Chloroflexota bacterium]
MNLKLMLDEAAGKYGQKTAIVSGQRRLSFSNLAEASDKVANGLIKMGVNKGDRVAMLLPNSPEFVAIFFGIVKTGAIAVPLDSKYKIDELTSLFNDSLPKVLVIESQVIEPLIPDLSRFKSIKHIIDLCPGYEGKFTTYQEIMSISSAQPVKAAPEPDDTALIAYTSGQSFHPTGVMLSHYSLAREALVSADAFEQTDKDTLMLFALPMHHMLGLVSVLLTSITKGSTVVMLPGLSMPTLTETIEKEKSTILIGVPFLFALLIRMAEKEGVKNNLSSLRVCCSAGAPLSIEIVQQFKQHFGLEIADCWGLTEAVCLVTTSPIKGRRKRGSIGKALPEWEVKVIDDNGRELPPNHNGEAIVRGPLMKGYYNNPQATSRVLKNGWLHTGDICQLDEDGNLFITGRKKDTIIIKGQNIYPADIEYVLSRHPKVAEAAVMGIPDELRGELVGAFINLKKGQTATEQEIKQFCLERITNYKVPKQIVFLDSLPKTASGKIDREKIREQLSIPPLFPKLEITRKKSLSKTLH